MSNARTSSAAKKKKKNTPPPQASTSSPSPIKRKTQDPDSAKVEAFSDSAKKSKSLTTQTDDELKSKVVLLKRKPGDFDPERVSWWEKGERVPFLFVALAFDLVSGESGRIVITDMIFCVIC